MKKYSNEEAELIKEFKEQLQEENVKNAEENAKNAEENAKNLVEELKTKRIKVICSKIFLTGLFYAGIFSVLYFVFKVFYGKNIYSSESNIKPKEALIGILLPLLLTKMGDLFGIRKTKRANEDYLNRNGINLAFDLREKVNKYLSGYENTELIAGIFILVLALVYVLLS